MRVLVLVLVLRMERGEGVCSPCAQRHVARGHGRLDAAHCFEALGGG